MRIGNTATRRALAFAVVLAAALLLCALIPSVHECGDPGAHRPEAGAVGQTERYTAPEAAAAPTDTLWIYNAARQPVTMLKPDGTVVSNAYDFAGRLSAVTASRNGESESIAYVYDDAGRVGSVSRNGSAVQYGYDTFLRTDETTPGGTLAWTCDNDFRVTGLSLNGTACATYAYDDDGGLVQAGDVTLTRATRPPAF